MGNASKIVAFAEARGLAPKKEFWGLRWSAICPNSKGKHRLRLFPRKETWQCQECKKKGDETELKHWIWVLDQERLSTFMKETESGDMSKETMAWWMGRY